MKLPWNEATEKEIGAVWLDAAIAPAAELGRRARKRERPFISGDELHARAAIGAVVRAAQALERETVEGVRREIAGAPDPSALLERASAGDALADTDFFELQRFVDGVRAVRHLLGNVTPALVEVPEALEDLETALAPGRSPSRSFFLADRFDPELARARGEAALRRETLDAARSALAARVARVLGLDYIRDGEFIVMRDQMTGAIPGGLRVIREAPTYYLCELALDDGALEAMGASDAADSVVAVCEERVRAQLALAIAQAATRVSAACHAIGSLDSFLARVRYAQKYDASEPAIVARGAALEFEAARFLPLEERLAETGQAYEPISLTLEHTAVVTGPNMGGKTAALRTCGFLAACVSRGLPVPALRASLPLFDSIDWIGIGRASEETALLSAFGSELVEVRELLERPVAPALVLIDEFARTTSPREGRALLIALLQTLRTREAHAFAATHLANIAEAANAAHYAIEGLRALEPRTGPPLPLAGALALIAGAMNHRLSPAARESAANSDAILLADMLGLERDFILRAQRSL
jgi:DNA mismatch repair ATPase MutS